PKACAYANSATPACGNAAFFNDILNVMKIRVNIDIKVGRIVKYFVLSDLFLLAGRGFVDPIFSVFIIQKIPGANLDTVGIATAIYLLLRSLLQIPISNYLDRTPGEKDDFIALI